MGPWMVVKVAWSGWAESFNRIGGDSKTSELRRVCGIQASKARFASAAVWMMGRQKLFWKNNNANGKVTRWNVGALG